MTFTPQFVWPSFAFDHKPLNEGFRQDLPDPTLASDFENGETRQRRIFRNAPTNFTGQWAMSPAAFKIFKAFVKTVGGCKFSVPVFAGDDYVTVSANFKKKGITAERQGGEWLVTAQIETMDKLADSGDQFICDLLAFGTDDSFNDVVSAYHTAVQTGFHTAMA